METRNPAICELETPGSEHRDPAWVVKVMLWAVPWAWCGNKISKVFRRIKYAWFCSSWEFTFSSFSLLLGPLINISSRNIIMDTTRNNIFFQLSGQPLTQSPWHVPFIDTNISWLYVSWDKVTFPILHGFSKPKPALLASCPFTRLWRACRHVTGMITADTYSGQGVCMLQYCPTALTPGDPHQAG